MSEPVRVVVVDDPTLVRQGIRTLLELAELRVVGEAGDGEEAMGMIAGEKPDVVLLDLRMPRFDGLWTLREIRARGLDVAVLVLTTFNEDARCWMRCVRARGVISSRT